MTPYSTGAATKKRGRQAAGADEEAEDGYEELERDGVEKRDSEGSDEDMSTDRMIVVRRVLWFTLKLNWHFNTF